MSGKSGVLEESSKTSTFSFNPQEQSDESLLSQLETQAEDGQQGSPQAPGTSSNPTPYGDSGSEKAIQANLAQKTAKPGQANLENVRLSLPRSRAGDEDPASCTESAAQRAENAARRAEEAACEAEISADKSQDAANYSALVLGKTQQQLKEVT